MHVVVYGALLVVSENCSVGISITGGASAGKTWKWVSSSVWKEDYV